MTRQPRWVKWSSLATAIVLPIGWLIAVIVSWDRMAVLAWLAYLEVRR